MLHASTPKIPTSDFSRNEKINERSNFVVADARRFATIGRVVNLEVGKEGRRFVREDAQHHHRQAADLQFGYHKV